ncbi:MAG: DUF2252 family protein [Elusimicrobia bacterium]|nr:DUF2252 family protein [Elusimicrobiota bacterium]
MKRLSPIFAATTLACVSLSGIALGAPPADLDRHIRGLQRTQWFMDEAGAEPLPELSSAQAVPMAGLERSYAKHAEAQNLTDVPYSFDQAKLDAANDSFHFLRSYVDYFYLLIKANRGSLRAVSAVDNVPGWCVGDAHPENFGVLIQNDGSSVFTMNDMDDSGPCPVVLDLYRLMVSSRLYSGKTKLDKLLQAYAAGLRGQTYTVPAPVTDMINKSQKKGITPDPKKIDGGKILRDSNMRDVDAGELAQIKAALASLGGGLSPVAKLLDAVATSKIGGGSGGLLRYEVLLDNGGALLQLEFKEEPTPSIYPVAAAQIPETTQRIPTTILMEQGSGASSLYSVAAVSGKAMLIRPRFDGNVAMSLDKQTEQDNKDIIRYEAYVLGRIHARSLQKTDALARLLQVISGSAWEDDVTLMTRHFDLKFYQLK